MIGVFAALIVGFAGLAAPRGLSAQETGFGIPTQGMTELDKATALEATIKALAANGSDAALEVLKLIVTGQLDFGQHSRLAAQLSLQELVKIENESVEDLLVQAAVNASNVRVGNRNRYGTGQLKTDVKRLLPEHASARVRTLLAEHYNRGVFLGNERTEIEEMLQAVQLANVPAQAKLLAGGRAKSELKRELRGYLSTYNEFAASGMFGFPRRWANPVPSGALGQGSQTPAASGPPDPIEIALILWTEDFVDAVSQSAQDEENQIAVLAPLVGAIPVEAARTRLAELLRESWTEGPGILLTDERRTGPATSGASPVRTPAQTNSGFGGPRRDDDDEEGEYTVRTPRRRTPRPARRSQANGSEDEPAEWRAGDANRFADLWLDPGVLVVFKKQLPYRQAPAGYRRESNNNNQRPTTRRQRVEELLKARAARRREMGLKYDWFNAIAAYVTLLTERCAAAADSDANSATSTISDTSDPGNSEQKPQGLPMPLHEGATIVTQYDLNWPQSLDPRLAQVVKDPFRVRYLRLEQTGGYARISRHYRSSLPGRPREWRAGDGVWLDVTHDGSSPESLQSIDVLIERETRNDALSLTTTSEDDVVTVHILVVEIPKSHLGQ